MFLKIRLPFDLVFIGSAGAIFSGGKAIIQFLYDDRYLDAAPIIQILSFSLLTSRFGPLSAIYLAVNEPRNQTVLNFVRAISIFVCIPLAYYTFGFYGALWAIALYGLPVFLVVFYFNRRHGLHSLPYELGVLMAWPAGFLAGTVATIVFERASGIF